MNSAVSWLLSVGSVALLGDWIGESRRFSPTVVALRWVLVRRRFLATSVKLSNCASDREVEVDRSWAVEFIMMSLNCMALGIGL